MLPPRTGREAGRPYNKTVEKTCGQIDPKSIGKSHFRSKKREQTSEEDIYVIYPEKHVVVSVSNLEVCLEGFPEDSNRKSDPIDTGVI